MIYTSYGLYIYGSSARRDATEHSDVDVLVVLGEGGLAKEYTIELPPELERGDSKLDLSFYGVDRLQKMYQMGHLFAWHLFRESRFLHVGQDYLAEFGKPAPYSRYRDDMLPLLRLLGSVREAVLQSPDNLVYEAGLTYVCARNIAMIASYYEEDGPTFSPYAPYCMKENNNPFPIARDRYNIFRSARLSGTRGIDPPEIQKNIFLSELEGIERWAQNEFDMRIEAIQT